MADVLELAAEREENFRQGLLEARKRPALAHTISATHCEDCGDEIPAARRLAVPGCECCIDCQQLREVRR
ncbi:TraR/DksA C4-type zinc finger protein [Pseudomonas nitroreducens]|uniref:TraR/DksA family transcriptional regulator n=1 Tax=Pseudomonas nitroreducens TaxID=46680 RepID=A0A6G6IV06_PSENT|nr:TraR/DksA C4-type zinc finger protein [Pseudomonas nitroreducens]QIE86975.1 TraR/DksA family transcriptional regulator [Pseudomonas nitroreducens]